jgi:hypothetical protein
MAKVATLANRKKGNKAAEAEDKKLATKGRKQEVQEDDGDKISDGGSTEPYVQFGLSPRGRRYRRGDALADVALRTEDVFSQMKKYRYEGNVECGKGY